MWNKIKNFFNKEQAQENWMSGMRFRESIKALGMEVYKDVTVVYLEKPSEKEANLSQPIYHFWHKNIFYSKEAETYEALFDLAHEDIDELCK